MGGWARGPTFKIRIVRFVTVEKSCKFSIPKLPDDTGDENHMLCKFGTENDWHEIPGFTVLEYNTMRSADISTKRGILRSGPLDWSQSGHLEEEG